MLELIFKTFFVVSCHLTCPRWFLLGENLMASRIATKRDLITEFENRNHNKILFST